MSMSWAIVHYRVEHFITPKKYSREMNTDAHHQ